MAENFCSLESSVFFLNIWQNMGHNIIRDIVTMIWYLVLLCCIDKDQRFWRGPLFILCVHRESHLLLSKMDDNYICRNRLELGSLRKLLQKRGKKRLLFESFFFGSMYLPHKFWIRMFIYIIYFDVCFTKWVLSQDLHGATSTWDGLGYWG